MKLTMPNGTMKINGKTYSGKCLTINGGVITIDGVTQDDNLDGDINITVEGDVNTIENTNGFVKCNNAGSIKTTNGDVDAQSVQGSVTTTNGDVCVNGSVGGSVKTVNGDIKHK